MFIDQVRVPHHVGIIMDGNGRWAQRQGYIRSFGHHSSTKHLSNIVEKAHEIGVKYLSLFGFSTENWGRPEAEVSSIFDVIENSVKNELQKVINSNIKISVVGEIDTIPQACRNVLMNVVEKTKNNSSFFLTLAINYSGSSEILKGVKKIIEEIQTLDTKIDLDNFDVLKFSSYMDTKDLPDIDLLIRTGGEYRLSNFMLTKLAYSELYFTDTMWPDFNLDNFMDAISEYKKRSRRFGKI